MASLRFCADCNNLLYPSASISNTNRNLIFSCRMCDYTELDNSNPLVYRNDLLTVTREQAGVTADVGLDMTLSHVKMKCPRCENTDCVAYQDQSKRKETRMTLFYVCTAAGCGFSFQDPALNNQPGPTGS